MLKVFGDSFSAIIKDHHQNQWFSIIERTLNKPLLNVAKAGATNLYILHTIIEQLPSITSNDIIIITLSGQGRLPIGANSRKSWFNDQDFFLSVDDSNKQKLTFKEQKNIQWYYDTQYLPEIVETDRCINNIINLVNFIDKNIGAKVILWNLTALNNTDNDSRFNDNVSESPSTISTNLWTPLSNEGKVGWVDIIYSNKLNISEEDLHPNVKGHLFIAKEFMSTLIPKRIL